MKKRSNTVSHIHQIDRFGVDEMEYLNNCQNLFSRAVYWESILEISQKQTLYTEKDIIDCIQDLPNQRVIKHDARRTRAIFFSQDLHENLKQFLTFYVKKEQIYYKQGLNELSAPFIFYKQISYPLDRIMLQFTTFVDTIIPNLYVDDDFMSLQCCFYFYTLLLRFHEPEFQQFLSKNNITPELYTTPWFITLFASKSSFTVSQLFFEFLSYIKDPIFIFYFAVGLMVNKKEYLMQFGEAELPQKLTHIKIENEEQFIEILKTAFKIKQYTPASFESKVRSTQMFHKNYHLQPALKKIMQEKLNEISKMGFLKIQPFEIYQGLRYLNFSLAYLCPNILCSTNITYQSSFPFIVGDQINCQHCLNGILNTRIEFPPCKGINNIQKLIDMIPLNHFKEINFFIYYMNFQQTEVEIKSKNIHIIDVNTITEKVIEKTINSLKQQPKPYSVIIVQGQKIIIKQDLEEKQLDQQFINAMYENSIQYLSTLEDGCEEFFLFMDQKLSLQQEKEDLSIPTENKQQENQYETQVLEKVHIKLDQKIIDLTKSLKSAIQKGQFYLMLNCKLTLNNEVFPKSALLFDNDQIIVLKQNEIVETFNEQLLEYKKLKVQLFINRRTIKTFKVVDQICILTVYQQNSGSKLQRIFDVFKLLQKSKSNLTTLYDIQIHFLNYQSMNDFCSRISHQFVQQI